MTKVPVAIVAGSGIDLMPLLDTVSEELPFSAISGLGLTDVAGHPGFFIKGRCDGHPVIVQSGRRHHYEGLSYAEVVSTVDVLRDWGVGGILFTNAAGGLVPAYGPGTLMAIDRIQPWPSSRIALPTMLELDWTAPSLANKGSYAWVHGPCYETRAEIYALQQLGNQVVGMSTAPEVHRCHELGLLAGGISCITNACGGDHILTHEEVLHVARRATTELCAVLRNGLPDFIRQVQVRP